MALGLYALCFYVFNLSFPQHSVKTLLFLQKYSFDINDARLDARVARIQRACVNAMDILSKWKPACTASSLCEKNVKGRKVSKASTSAARCSTESSMPSDDGSKSPSSDSTGNGQIDAVLASKMTSKRSVPKNREQKDFLYY